MEKKKQSVSKKHSTAKKTTKETKKSSDEKKSEKTKGAASEKKSHREVDRKKVEDNIKTIIGDYEKKGIYVSVSRVGDYMIRTILNPDIISALDEIKEFRGKVKKIKDKDGEVLEEQVMAPKSLRGLSEYTYGIIRKAIDEKVRQQKIAHAKLFVKKMTEEEKKRYTEEKAKEKKEKEDFDEEIFNERFNGGFYSEYSEEKFDFIEINDYKKAISLISKGKLRHSNDSKFYIAALVDELCMQMLKNGIYCTVESNRSTINMDKVLDMSSENAYEKFPLYPLVSNFVTIGEFESDMARKEEKSSAESKDTEKKVNRKGAKSDKEKKSSAKKTKSKAKEKVEHKEDEEEERLKALGLDKFRYVFGDLHRVVKSKLYNSYRTSRDRDKRERFYGTWLGKDVKNYGSRIVCELIRVIGQMLKTYTDCVKVKTIRDRNVLMIIEQLFNAHQIPFDIYRKIIQDKVKVYMNFTEDRREERKGEKDNVEEKKEKKSSMRKRTRKEEREETESEVSDHENEDSEEARGAEEFEEVDDEEESYEKDD
jgi:hypothetical protein